MKKQKEGFVTRAEFEELRAAVSRYQVDVVKALEDRFVCFEELEAIKAQVSGRPVSPPGRFLQTLRKERGLDALGMKKGHVFKMVPTEKV